jgi:O-antigen/teichoic acid export membrane protein
LSIWYKLTDQTKYGAYITLIGAVITLTLNFVLIPIIGYYGSAWATFVCYFVMMVLSYILGQKHYRVEYKTGRMIYYILFAVAIYLVSTFIPAPSKSIHLLVNTALLLIYFSVLFLTERKILKQMFTNS